MSKDRIISVIDKCAFFFFIVLAIFIPISNAGIESSFGFISLCFIVRIIFKRPTREEVKAFFKNRINFYLLIFYIAIGLSIFVSGPLWTKSLRAWVAKWGEGVLLFYFAQIFLNKKQVKIILLVMIASACLLSIDGIYQRVIGLDFIRSKPLKTTDFGDLAVTGTFGHYNGFAAYLGVLLFITIGFLGYVKKFWHKAPLFLLLLLISANVMLALSRGAWFSLLITCLLAMVLVNNKKAKIFFLLFLTSFLWIMFSIPLLRERLLTIIEKGGDADRFKVWRVALLMFKESPLFGKGVGLFTTFFPKYIALNVQYTHNCYLQVLAETGLLGFTSFIWFLGVIFIRGYKKLREKFDGVFFGLFFGLLIFLVHSFFDVQLFTLRLSILFWLLASFVTIYLSHSGCKAENNS